LHWPPSTAMAVGIGFSHMMHDNRSTADE